MIFTSPTWLPALDQDPAKLSTVAEFVLQGSPNKDQTAAINEPIIFSASGQKSLSPRRIQEDVEALAAGLAEELKWAPNEVGQKRIVAILSENTVDYMTYCWAVHRLRGTCLLLHTTTSPAENADHIRKSGCSILISSPASLQSATATIAALGTPDIKLILTEDIPAAANGSNGVNADNAAPTNGHSPTTLTSLMNSGKSLGSLPALTWSTQEAQSSIAFLCPTSGTSGVQKIARLTHRGLITNVLQTNTSESSVRKTAQEVVLCVTPLSHVQGVISILGSVYVRDKLILHTHFDMKAALTSVQAFKINRLYLVPAILANLLTNPFLFKMFDLSSVQNVYVGSGSLSAPLYAKAKAVQPNWSLVTGYGLTEASMIVSMTNEREIVPGSSGVLMPLYQARLEREDGTIVDAFDEPGELVVTGPNIASGYEGDDEASQRTFKDGWLYTGDIAVFKKSPQGDSHLFIVDRLRDMIKVKGLQISPVTIESCLRASPWVADVAVIGVTDAMGAGERPKAYVVPSKAPSGPEEVAGIFKELEQLVQTHLSEPHWIRGQYELLEALPRNTSGKVAKGVLRAKAAQKA